MKKLLLRMVTCLAYACLGCLYAILCGFIAIIPVPTCGEDCSNAKFGTLFLFALAGFTAFAILGIYRARIKLIFTVLIIFMLIAGGNYIRFHQSYRNSVDPDMHILL